MKLLKKMIFPVFVLVFLFVSSYSSNTYITVVSEAQPPTAQSPPYTPPVSTINNAQQS